MAVVIKENSAENVSDDASGRSYERSKIGFPYGDLDDALQVAKAVGGNRGLASVDQLAAFMDHESVTSGTFRVKLSTARIFGLVDMQDDRVSLTDLGNQIIRADTEAAAKVHAFLHVPLYRAIYEKYKGRLLPGDRVLEEDMVALGVAQKQKRRARQGFQRSAEQANVGKDRLVVPAGVSLDSATIPLTGGKSRKMETPLQQLSGEINPAIAVFIEELPASGEWTREERDFWTRIFLRTLDRVYKIKE